MEVAESDAWPAPPHPCGVIAGTRSLSPVNPTSWITNAFGMLRGAAADLILFATSVPSLPPSLPVDRLEHLSL